MNELNPFRTSFAENIFRAKYSVTKDETWSNKCYTCVDDVCGRQESKGKIKTPIMSTEDRKALVEYMSKMKWLPGGRYIYYAGRQAKFYNNCFLLRAEEDTREEWAAVSQRAISCLMTGGGIGIDYSRLREKGKLLRRTGGNASGPIPLMEMINEDGRRVMQGGSRRSAIYASLDREHPDVNEFLKVKNWKDIKISGARTEDGKQFTYWDAKNSDFNFSCPLDMTNISVNYNDKWLNLPFKELDPVYIDNVRQACETGEPGFSFNFGDRQDETLRNACTEVTSFDDSDVCNLASINMAEIETLEEFKQIVYLVSKFLVCGTIRAQLPYDKVYKIREKNRRLGLGLMGIHAWLLKRGYGYEVVDELKTWLQAYKEESERGANEHCERLFLSKPVAYRAIAPTGSIGILASTTTGIEPLFALAYKRRYLMNGSEWHYEYVVDSIADRMIKDYGLDPEKIETAYSLSKDPEKRIKFQYEVQKYVDMSISSTINLPQWGTEFNNEDTLKSFGSTLAKYAHGLRGFTCYPDGSRGGQPLTEVSYKEALDKVGTVFKEHDICSISGKGGVCGS